MDTTGYIALSRQIALERHMTTIANNIANANTSGYRAEHTLFEPFLEQAGEPRQVAFVQDVGLYRDLTPGPIAQTGNPLDLAIDGEGYLTVQTPAGERYTRGGHLGLDASGRLVDAQGSPVLDEGGSPVTVPPGESQLTVGEDGTLTGAAGPIAKLQLVTVGNEEAMAREGGGLYASSEVPRPATGRLVQGAIEGSNTVPVLEMTSLMATVRAFQGVQQLVDAQDELDRDAIQHLVSVSS
jgi:flagellar basal-body rod protein FlgF